MLRKRMTDILKKHMQVDEELDEEVRRRIFEPFFTTKEATGTGLGLWVSAEVIHKHHGSIRIRSLAAVQSENDGSMRSGTVFMIFFPFVRNEETQAESLQGIPQSQSQF